MVPLLSSLASPLLLCQSRLGGEGRRGSGDRRRSGAEQEEVTGPSLPLLRAHSPHPSSVVALQIIPGCQ